MAHIETTHLVIHWIHSPKNNLNSISVLATPDPRSLPEPKIHCHVQQEIHLVTAEPRFEVGHFQKEHQVPLGPKPYMSKLQAFLGRKKNPPLPQIPKNLKSQNNKTHPISQF